MTLPNAVTPSPEVTAPQSHLYICDSEGTCLHGTPVSELEGQRLTTLAGEIWSTHGLPPSLAPQLESCIQQVLNTGAIVRVLIQDVVDATRTLTYACQVMPTPLEGDSRGIAIKVQQLPEPRDGQDDAVNQQMVDVVPVPVVVARVADWKCLYGNAAAATLLGLPAGQLVGRSLAPFFDQSNDPDRLLENLVTNQQVTDFETCVLDQDGQRHRTVISGGCTFARGNQAAMLFLSPAPERRVPATLRERDALTGLPNRTALADRLEEAIRRAGPRQQKVAALFIDLNRFKNVNDEHGHRVGDELLAVVARRIAGCVRHYETVGRLGGDEFVVILEGLDGEQETLRMKQDVQRVVSKPVRVAGLTLSVTASIGIACFPRDAGNAVDLIHTADRAMYREKPPRHSAV
ncbi:diguanylate cyclase domain-containing protein [Aquisalimonas asiatica]|uniref:Diguanylate cyclase (GGDEF) domain-containing protein n=1 Tax=Aquisalimonas asiatica TaxID=406100 RepID=A0A1H8Q2H7_9GAMM|nr:diguanylate cyclase [Aquisalimonas asiatica]SEO48286.1 diguanylate cyclase (GGDEF) domain-containing protein [Aquisalimonas asiatica]